MRRVFSLRSLSLCFLSPLSVSQVDVGTKRYVMPLPKNQDDFSAYNEIDLPSESRIEAIRKAGLAQDDWIGIEKVHGTNFGLYLLNEETMRYAKRSGIMDPTENFFGYHLLCDEFTRVMHAVLAALKAKYELSGKVGRVVLNGELFGAKYKHPLVPKSTKWATMPNGKKIPIAGVNIQREPFPQYSPELHFFAFDLKYSCSGAEEDFVVVTYDDFVEVCSSVSGLLYGKALVRGTLDRCLAFDVENFKTPLPAMLGLGNYPLEGNLAEGIVIRHAQRGSPALERKNVSTIIKLRCSSFMELKHPGKQQELKETFVDTIRAAAIRRVGSVSGVTVIAEALLPSVERAANALLLNHVSEGRLSNVLSKIGREPLLKGEVNTKEVALMLSKDALKDFLKDTEEAVLNTSLSFRDTLIRNCYLESVKLVTAKWAELIKEQQEEAQSESAAAAAA